MPDGNISSLPKGVKAQRKRLADGSLAIYHYWRDNGAPIAGLPGTPEFLASVEAAKTAVRRSRAQHLDARAYSSRLAEFADRAVKTAAARARVRKLEFAVTLDDIKEIIERQGECCAVTGLRFDLAARPARIAPYQPSIDRIDSRKGYVRGNVRIVCFAVNVAIGEWGDAVFLKIAEAAVHTAWQRKPPYG